MEQVRVLIRQPEIIVGTWRAAQTEAPDLTETEVHDALGRLDLRWSLKIGQVAKRVSHP